MQTPAIHAAAIPPPARQTSDPLQLRVALLGNPNSYPEWTDARLASVREAGFNAIQINIAWLSRPNDEALNLRDVVTLPADKEATRTAQRRDELHKRATLAHKAGLRTIFHFGSPYMWRNPETGEVKPQNPETFHANPPWFDVTNPKVVEYETALLRKFRSEFPEVDDILVYTYDQDAWQASEFGIGPSRGVPLHERLHKYLYALHIAWTEGRETSCTMWWEPWELSAGQVLKCVPQLPRFAFGLMLHSNIAEVQIAYPVDVWFRNTARMAQEFGIPVIAEGFFGSATEEIQPLAFPFPRLTDEQFLAVTSVAGVNGVKEYFGITTDEPDYNLHMFTARLKNPGKTTQALLQMIAKDFGAQQEAGVRLFQLLSDAMQLFPWDVSWYARLAGTALIDHGWRAAAIRGQQVETPSWESTRRSHFMMTEDKQPHPFLLEDVQLRCELALKKLAEARVIGRVLIATLPDSPDRKAIIKALSDVDKFRRVVSSYALHIRETNVAMLLRGDLSEGRPMTPHLLNEMEALLIADVENQGGTGRVVEMQQKFKADPAAFVKEHLLPFDKDVRERGIFTLTTR
ncbi:MAG: hypothetical protein ACR2IE_00635 [Candidatus Sumerlaeaceae bacterium]